MKVLEFEQMEKVEGGGDFAVGLACGGAGIYAIGIIAGAATGGFGFIGIMALGVTLCSASLM